MLTLSKQDIRTTEKQIALLIDQLAERDDYKATPDIYQRMIWKKFDMLKNIEAVRHWVITY